MSPLNYQQQMVVNGVRCVYFIPKDSYEKGKGYRVCLVFENHSGYYPMNGHDGPMYVEGDYKDACREAKIMSRKEFKLTDGDIDAIIHSSLIAADNTADDISGDTIPKEIASTLSIDSQFRILAFIGSGGVSNWEDVASILITPSGEPLSHFVSLVNKKIKPNTTAYHLGDTVGSFWKITPKPVDVLKALKRAALSIRMKESIKPAKRAL